MLFTRYAAGADTRNQFTTPPDNRVVQDLADVAQITTGGGQVTGTTDGYDNTFKVIPVTVGNLIADDGNWNTSYNCWGPPSSWFTAWDGTSRASILVDCFWQVQWPDWSGGNSSAFLQVDFRVRNQANPSGATVSQDVYGLSQVEVRHGFGATSVFSGTVPGIAMTSGKFIEMRINQTSGTYMSSIPFRWGISPRAST